MKPIDRALRWFGVYRSVDVVFRDAFELREKRQVFVPPDALPNTINTLKDVLATAKIPNVKVKCTFGSALCACNDTIYVDYVAEEWTEAQRAFALAHELGHIVGDHSEHTFKILRKALPGWVHPLRIKKALYETESERNATSHRHEYEADRYATLIMMQMGYDLPEIVDAVETLIGESYTTLTHPSMERRVQSIKWYHENASVPE